MAAHCGPNNYTIVQEGEEAIGTDTYSREDTNGGHAPRRATAATRAADATTHGPAEHAHGDRLARPLPVQWRCRPPAPMGPPAAPAAGSGGPAAAPAGQLLSRSVPIAKGASAPLFAFWSRRSVDAELVDGAVGRRARRRADRRLPHALHPQIDRRQLYCRGPVIGMISRARRAVLVRRHERRHFDRRAVDGCADDAGAHRVDLHDPRVVVARGRRWRSPTSA